MDENRRGVPKLVLVVVLLALVILGYVFLTDEPEGVKTPSENVPAQGQVISAKSPRPVLAPDIEENASTAMPSEPRPDWKTSKMGDETRFSLRGGQIGYVDVTSVLQNRDPSSILALLQSHKDLTSADESLDIEIVWAGENEQWGYEATFIQLIEGQYAGPLGTLFFSSDGAVSVVHAKFVNTKVLTANSVVIARAEAEAIAYETAVRHAANLPNPPESRGLERTIEALPAEMQYNLGPDNHLRREWRVPVMIRRGANLDDIWVFVAPETGEVLDIRSAIRAASSSGPRFRVCDANKNYKISTCTNPSAKQIFDANACQLGEKECKEVPDQFQVPNDTAIDVIDTVNGVSRSHTLLADEQIDIVLRYPLGEALLGVVSPGGKILISSKIADDNELLKAVTAHEVFHKLSRTPNAPIQEGLASAMEALYVGGNHWGHKTRWAYDLTKDRKFQGTYTVDPTVANAIYRVSQKVGEQSAFEFVMRVDGKGSKNTKDFQENMKDVGADMGIGSEVAAVLADMGVTQTKTDLSTCNQATLKVGEEYTSEGGIGEGWVKDLAKQGLSCDEIENTIVGWVVALIEADAPSVPAPERWPGNWPPQKPTPPRD